MTAYDSCLNPVYRAQLKSQNVKTTMLGRYSASDFVPVGFGLAGNSCGEIVGRAVCGHCWTALFGRSWCNRRDCPVCHVHWADQGARRISGRLASKEAISTFFGLRLLRGVISPAVELYPSTAMDYVSLRRSAIRELKRCGVVGGLVVFHAYRGTDLIKEYAGANKLKVWDAVRELQASGLDFKSLVGLGFLYFSPHFHWVGYARHTKAGSRGDWVFRVFAGEPLNKSNGHFLWRDGVAVKVHGHIRYLLSHCSSFGDCGKDTQSYTWFGRRFKAEVLRNKRACPLCQSVDLIRWSAMSCSLLYGDGFGCPADKRKALVSAVVEGVMPDNPIMLDGDV